MRNIRQYYTISVQSMGLSIDSPNVSICIMDWCGRYFYGEFNNIASEDIASAGDKWGVGPNDTFVADKVIPALILGDGNSIFNDGEYHIRMLADPDTIGREIRNWIYEVNMLNGSLGVQLISDCGAYDFVKFVDIVYGNALQIPKFVSPALIDINDYISSVIAVEDDSREINEIPEAEAFNVVREITLGNLFFRKSETDTEGADRLKIFRSDITERGKLPYQNALSMCYQRRMLIQIIMWPTNYLCWVYGVQSETEEQFIVDVHTKKSDASNTVTNIG